MNDIRFLEFTKMQGAGNDFIVVDNREELLALEDVISLAPQICDRKFGVGADGILLIEEAKETELDYTMIYRNADGSDAGMCGNGARCLALFATKLGMSSPLSFKVHDKTYRAEVESPNHIEVSFPFTPSVSRVDDLQDSSIYQTYPGTEHVVFQVDKEQFQNKDFLAQKGSQLRYNERFAPVGTNVNFFCPKGTNSIQLHTYERGVEKLTLACGTGAIASSLVWHHLQKQANEENKFTVKTEGGTLTVRFKYDPEKSRYEEIALIGPARIVFNGEYYV